MDSPRSGIFVAVRSVVYAAAFIALWTWLALTVRGFDASLPFRLSAWLRPVGALAAVAGAVLALLSIATFLTRGRGTPAPFDPPRVFVASGPYRYVRNPMYVGAALAMLGAGLAVSSPSIVLLALGFLILMHGFVVLYEEPALEARFGDSYRAYKASVHRWRLRIPERPGHQG